MKTFLAENIRNAVFAGHGGAGKTSLAEAALYLFGSTDRLGKVTDGNTVLDFDAEEKKRKISLAAAIAPVLTRETKINIIDTPGLFDFAGGVAEGMRAADAAVIVLSGKSGLSVGAEKGFKAAKGKARMFFVTKLDSESADFYKVYNTLKDTYGSGVCPVVVPYVVDRKLQCLVDLVSGKAYKYDNGKPVEVPLPELANYDEMVAQLNEAVAETDEELMEKFFEGEAFTREEIVKGLRAGVSAGTLYPVFSGAGQSMWGVDMLVNALVDYAPSPLMAKAEKAVLGDGKETEIKIDENGAAAAIIFKTVADPFVGKLSYFKVIRGKVTADSHLINSRTGDDERIGKVFAIKGGKQEEVPFISAGDVGAVAKLARTGTGDTLCAADSVLTFKGADFPAPCYSVAVKPKAKGEEEKIAQGIIRILEEDMTISFATNTETHEQILSGLGEQHLDVIISKVKQKFGVDMTLSIPKVAYRETIRKKVKVEGRHKKQTGGHGQFGHVWIEFEPCDSPDLEFAESVFGGAVPRGFFPAVEKGLRECINKGVLAGYPVVGLKATLVDGSYHPVDSSEMSFKMAAALAYKAGLPQASPTILEPIGSLKVLVDEAHMGDIIGEVNKRRGRVLGMNPSEESGMEEVAADVPMAEMGDFSTFLRSATQGRGVFSLEFGRYEEAPPNIAAKIIEEAKAAAAE